MVSLSPDGDINLGKLPTSNHSLLYFLPLQLTCVPSGRVESGLVYLASCYTSDYSRLFLFYLFLVYILSLEF